MIESEGYYKIIADYSIDCEIYRDQEQKLQYVNPSFDQITGYGHQEYLTGKISFDDFIHPNDLQKAHEYFQKSINKIQFNDIELRIIKKNGDLAYISVSSQPAITKDGIYLGTRTSIREITQRKKNEQLLKLEQERFKDFCYCSVDWVWEVDKNGEYTFIAGNIKDILGYEPSEVIGLTPFHLMKTEEAERVKEEFIKILNAKEPIVDLINWNITKNGNEVCLLTNGRPILDDNGELIGYRGVDKDITDKMKIEIERKQTHKLIHKLNTELEQKVIERTAEIKRLLTQKDEFIYQLGHDLKSPLAPIVSLLPVLKKKCTSDEEKEIHEVLSRNTEYMKNLVSKTLQLAHLNSPSTSFTLTKMNLHQEIEKNILQNKKILEGNNIIVKNLIPIDFEITVDQLRLQELLNNIISNAVKYTKGPGFIFIDAMNIGEEIKISIKDTGIGIKNEDVPLIFNEFHKIDTSRHDIDCSGLGLPICKRIVEKHNGRIWVESEGPGKGSTFYFTIPNNKCEESIGLE